MKKATWFGNLFAMLLILVAFASPASAVERIDIADKLGGSDPLASSDLQSANGLMWDIVKLLIAVFVLTLVLNAFMSGTSLNISGIMHSVSIRSHGISGLFIAAGSVVGVLLTLWVCIYLWNNYLTAV